MDWLNRSRPGRYGRYSRHIKKVRVLAIVTVTSLLLTACGQSPQQGEPGGQAPAVVTIWHSLQGAEASALEEQTQVIAGRYPEVLIETEYVAESDFAALAYQAEAGGEGPEIFIARQEILDQMYAQGALAPVVSGNTEGVEAAAARFRYGEDYYARPWLTDVPVLYYRTDLAAKPKTLNELTESKAVTVMTGTSMANLSTWWSAQGGKLIDGQHLALDSVANQEFLTWLLAWQEQKSLLFDPNAFNVFAQGQAAYYIGPASQAQLLTNRHVPWGSVSLTELTGGTGMGLLGTTLGIANSTVRTTPEMVEAIRIVEDALLAPQTEGAMAQAGRRLPANLAFYDQPEAQTGVYPAARQGLTSAWPLAGISLERKLFSAQEKAWGKALNGEVTGPEALAEAQLEAERISTSEP